jgi:hypothetical protein
MQDFETTTEDASSDSNRAELRERVVTVLVNVFKKFIIFVSFGPGVFGLLWLIGRIFKKR